jgi:hypothetical protein
LIRLIRLIRFGAGYPQCVFRVFASAERPGVGVAVSGGTRAWRDITTAPAPNGGGVPAVSLVARRVPRNESFGSLPALLT